MRRSSKYNARRVEHDGYTFDSQAERDRYVALKLLEQIGDIEGLTVHPRLELLPTLRRKGKLTLRKVSYVADFLYIENGQMVVEDVKGFPTPVFRLKANMFQRRYPDMELRIVKV